MSFEVMKPELLRRDGLCPTVFRASAGSVVTETGQSHIPVAVFYYGTDFGDFKSLVELAKTKWEEMAQEDFDQNGNTAMQDKEEIYLTVFTQNRQNPSNLAGYKFERAFLMSDCNRTDPYRVAFNIRQFTQSTASDNAATWLSNYGSDPRHYLDPVRFASKIVEPGENPPYAITNWVSGELLDPFGGGVTSLRPGCKKRQCSICVACEIPHVHPNIGDRVLIMDTDKYNPVWNPSRDGIYEIVSKPGEGYHEWTLRRADDFQLGTSFDFPSVVVAEGIHAGKTFTIPSVGVLGQADVHDRWSIFYPTQGVDVESFPGPGTPNHNNSAMTFVVKLKEDVRRNYCTLPAFRSDCAILAETGERPEVCSEWATSPSASNYGAECKGVDYTTGDMRAICSADANGALTECDCEARGNRKSFRRLQRDPRSRGADACWWNPCRTPQSSRWLSDQTAALRGSSGTCPSVCLSIADYENISNSLIEEVIQNAVCVQAVDDDTAAEKGVSQYDLTGPGGGPSDEDLIASAVNEALEEREAEEDDGGGGVNIALVVGLVVAVGVIFLLVAVVLRSRATAGKK